MRILILDNAGLALDFSMRATNCGHKVKHYIPETPSARLIGKGLVDVVRDYKPWLNWADMIFLPDNINYLGVTDRIGSDGPKVFGATKVSSQWEINREVGMQAFKKAGIPVPPYKIFTRMDEAIAHVKKTKLRYVAKPTGDDGSDKTIAYCAKGVEDMIFMMEHVKKTCGNTPFMLQEFKPGVEMAVGGWLGPHGFNCAWCENWEFKKLMNDDAGVNCYDAETEVLTSEGWKYWPEVTETDELATLVNDKLEFEVPSKLVAKEVDEELIGWRSPTVDILVTAGHNMYVQDSHGRKPFFFEPAEETAYKIRRVSKGAASWTGYDYGVSEGFAKLLGAYIADGSCKQRSIVFGNCPEHKVKKFTEFAAEVGLEAKLYGPDLYINSVKLTNAFHILGKAHEKSVPQNIKDSPPIILQAFLDGYLAGDGSKHRSAPTIYAETVSKRLADDLQEIALKLGMSCVISERNRTPSHYINGVKANSYRTAYALSIGREKLCANLAPDICYREHYNGVVYCATVTTHILLVRRNGKPVWLGNTGEMGTVVRYTKSSKLAKKVLAPLEDMLVATGHVGYVDVNCIVDAEGNPWPLEFTMRPGWPTFNIQQVLHEGDCAEWMLDCASGLDQKNCTTNQVALGVYLAIADFPYNKRPLDEVKGVPLYGLTPGLERWFHPLELMAGMAPKEVGQEVVNVPMLVTAGTSMGVVTATGSTVAQAQEKVYRRVKRLASPSSLMYRTDIGTRLRKQLPLLQANGYATGLTFS